MKPENRYLLSEKEISLIADILQTDINNITDIEILKNGMTNRAFLFRCGDKRYIIRIPGEGTEYLINRANEAAVYQTLRGKGISDENIYIDPVNGYKITKYMEGARNCDALNQQNVTECMKKLRQFHQMKLHVGHEFDLFDRINYYESLWEKQYSIYPDYADTKANILSLRHYIEAHTADKVLTHIDAVPDNFLFVNENGAEKIYLIDWEYAGMQDPHVDIAMFGIYAFYDRQQMENLIDTYFEDHCTGELRIKVYCYIAVSGLLWSNWCEFKRQLGVDFGEYALRQYQYAKEYYCIVRDELGEECLKWGIK